MLDLSLVPRSF